MPSNTPPNRFGQAATPATAIQEQLVAIAGIVREPALMMRVKLSEATVEKYAAAMKAGAVFPPVEIMQIDGKLLLTGGFHRTAAAASNGDTTILAQVRFGTMGQAILAAARAGAHEGLARTNDDKRKAVEALLTTEWGKTHSDHLVAEAAGASQTFVSNLRREMATENGAQLKPERQGKDGKVRPARRPRSTPGQTVISAETRKAASAEEEVAQLDAICREAKLEEPALAAPANDPPSTVAAITTRPTEPVAPAAAPTTPRPNAGGCDSSGANRQQLRISLEKVAAQLVYVARKHSAAEIAAFIADNAALRSQFAKIAPGWLNELATALSPHGQTVH